MDWPCIDSSIRRPPAATVSSTFFGRKDLLLRERKKRETGMDVVSKQWILVSFVFVLFVHRLTD